MADLSRILKDIISRDFSADIVMVSEVWDKCVGVANAEKARPLYLKAGRLTVSCDSSSCLFEMRRIKHTIIDRLNDYLGNGKIKDIYFRQ